MLCSIKLVQKRGRNWVSNKLDIQEETSVPQMFFFIILLNIVTGHNYKWKSKIVFDQMNGWNTDHIKSQIYGIAHKRHCLPLFRTLKQILSFFYLCFFRKWKKIYYLRWVLKFINRFEPQKFGNHFPTNKKSLKIPKL